MQFKSSPTLIGLAIVLFLGVIISEAFGAGSIKWHSYPEGIALGKQKNKKVFVNFFADWCTYCKQMERQTFTDPKVAGLMSEMTLLQADVTRQDDADKALQDHIGIPAPPAMIFWTPGGEEIRHLRLLGFKGPEPFAQHLNEALSF